MKSIKSKLIFLAIVMLTAAGLSAALILAYLSDQRWTAFGTIGTWITGGSAALIAYSQHREQKIRETELTFKSISNVKHDVSMLSERLLNLFHYINDEVEECLIKNAPNHNLPSPVHFKQQLSYYCSLIKAVGLDPVHRSHLPQHIENDVNDLSQDVETFLAQIDSFSSFENNYVKRFFAIFNATLGFNQLISSIIKSIDDQNPYLDLLEEQLTRACELNKKEKSLRSAQSHP